TYNGLWCIVPDRTHGTSTLYSLNGIAKPVKLPSVPANFSGGSDPSRVVVVSKTRRSLEGVDVKTGKDAWTLEMTDFVVAIWVNPAGSIAIAELANGDLVSVDALSGRLLAHVPVINLRLTSLTFTPGGTRIFSCGADGRAILWDARTLERLREFRGNA